MSNKVVLLIQNDVVDRCIGPYMVYLCIVNNCVFKKKANSKLYMSTHVCNIFLLWCFC